MGLGLAVVALATAGSAAPATAAGCKGADVRAQDGGLAKAARATLCLVNTERSQRGLERLKLSKQLRKAARGHSKDMVANQFFAHDSPSGSTIPSRAKKAGYTRKTTSFLLREDLGWGAGERSSPRKVVEAWMASTVHRENILNAKLRDAGIGIAKGSPFGGPGATYTLAFGQRKRAGRSS